MGPRITASTQVEVEAGSRFVDDGPFGRAPNFNLSEGAPNFNLTSTSGTFGRESEEATPSATVPNFNLNSGVDGTPPQQHQQHEVFSVNLTQLESSLTSSASVAAPVFKAMSNGTAAVVAPVTGAAASAAAPAHPAATFTAEFGAAHRPAAAAAPVVEVRRVSSLLFSPPPPPELQLQSRQQQHTARTTAGQAALAASEQPHSLVSTSLPADTETTAAMAPRQGAALLRAAAPHSTLGVQRQLTWADDARPALHVEVGTGASGASSRSVTWADEKQQRGVSTQVEVGVTWADEKKHLLLPQRGATATAAAVAAPPVSTTNSCRLVDYPDTPPPQSRPAQVDIGDVFASAPIAASSVTAPAAAAPTSTSSVLARTDRALRVLATTRSLARVLGAVALLEGLLRTSTSEGAAGAPTATSSRSAAALVLRRHALPALVAVLRACSPTLGDAHVTLARKTAGVLASLAAAAASVGGEGTDSSCTHSALAAVAAPPVVDVDDARSSRSDFVSGGAATAVVMSQLSTLCVPVLLDGLLVFRAHADVVAPLARALSGTLAAMGGTEHDTQCGQQQQQGQHECPGPSSGVCACFSAQRRALQAACVSPLTVPRLRSMATSLAAAATASSNAAPAPTAAGDVGVGSSHARSAAATALLEAVAAIERALCQSRSD